MTVNLYVFLIYMSIPFFWRALPYGGNKLKLN